MSSDDSSDEEIPAWVLRASERFAGLSSRANEVAEVTQRKRAKLEQEAADEAMARRLQQEEEEALARQAQRAASPPRAAPAPRPSRSAAEPDPPRNRRGRHARAAAARGQAAATGVAEHAASCDGCSMDPIIGMRYQRQPASEDFDLCAGCFDTLPRSERADFQLVRRNEMAEVIDLGDETTDDEGMGLGALGELGAAAVLGVQAALGAAASFAEHVHHQMQPQQPPPRRGRPPLEARRRAVVVDSPQRVEVVHHEWEAENAPPQAAHAEAHDGSVLAMDAMLQGFRDHVPGERLQKPDALRVQSLYPYQEAALAWMVRRERPGADGGGSSGEDSRVLGGLLADEMGLGKTVQILALCVHHAPPLSAAPVGGMLAGLGGARAALGTLIVCPLMLVKQWEREIRAKVAPPFSRNVCIHHGSGRDRSGAKLAGYDFVITTYSVVRSERGSDRSGTGALFQLRWWRVVLDEAHYIKNPSAGASKAACELRAVHRWCMSGTPLQNTADDIFPLLKFLKYPRFGDSLGGFRALIDRKAGLKRLQAVLNSLMLRRRKLDRFGGAPILELPAKVESVMEREFTPEERDVYAALESRARVAFNRFLQRGGIQANYVHILVLLTRLRQACDSARLVAAAFEEVEPAEERPLPAPTRSRAEALAADDAPPEDCPICMDTIQVDIGAITACGHVFCQECITEHAHRGEAAEDGKAKCPLCRAFLTAEELFAMQTLPAFAEKREAERAREGREGDGATNLAEATPPCSTKMLMVRDQVRAMLAKDAGGKAIVFSSYTKFLDLLGPMLKREGLSFARVDGSQNMRKREDQIHAFHGAGVPVLLMSLKCGIGLNLTCASTVILCEPWWNPFVEEQAIDRAHRIGQRKDVQVIRLTVPNTVEDRILALGAKKRETAAAALGDDVTDATRRAAARLSDHELRELFGFNR